MSDWAEMVDAACRVVYDRVKRVETLTFDIAYPSEQDDFRRVLDAALTAAGVHELQAEIERLHEEQRRLNNQIHAQKAEVGDARRERDQANKKLRTEKLSLAGQQRVRQAAENEVERLRAALTTIASPPTVERIFGYTATEQRDIARAALKVTP